MTVYLNCPKGLSIVEENPLYARVVKVRQSASGGLNSLIVPAQYWSRFCTDQQFKNSMMSSFSKHIFTDEYPENEVMVGGRLFRDTGGMEKPGRIPETVPLITKFSNCPSGYLIERETDERVTLYCHYQAGMMGGKLEVPSTLWDRFCTDREWRNKVTLKYARMLELDDSVIPEHKREAIPDHEYAKTGVIPEDA